MFVGTSSQSSRYANDDYIGDILSAVQMTTSIVLQDCTKHAFAYVPVLPPSQVCFRVVDIEDYRDSRTCKSSHERSRIINSALEIAARLSSNEPEGIVSLYILFRKPRQR